MSASSIYDDPPRTEITTFGFARGLAWHLRLFRRYIGAVNKPIDCCLREMSPNEAGAKMQQYLDSLAVHQHHDGDTHVFDPTLPTPVISREAIEYQLQQVQGAVEEMREIEDVLRQFLEVMPLPTDTTVA